MKNGGLGRGEDNKLSKINLDCDEPHTSSEVNGSTYSKSGRNLNMSF